MKCKTVDVLTVVTGIMLVDGSESDFQGVMDVLYPGIMTIGCAAMQSHAAEEIQRQHPEIREFLATHHPDKGLVAFNEQAIKDFGELIEVTGPHNVSKDTIQKAFDALGTKDGH